MSSLCIYFSIGNKFDMKNHYRGHKLSLWLNLIPQLHMPGDLNELPIRHHHFSESDPKFYDGIVRARSTEKPVFIKPAILKNDITLTPTKALVTTVATLTGKLSCNMYVHLSKAANVTDSLQIARPIQQSYQRWQPRDRNTILQTLKIELFIWTVFCVT